VYQWVEESLVLSGARWVAATTDDYAKHSALRRTPAEKVVVLPNGVDTTVFRPERNTDALRARYGLSEDEPIVLFVGGLDTAHYFKGIPILLQSIARLPGVRVLVIGEGDLRPSYREMAHQSGLEERVQFTGHVSQEELPLHYNLADVVVLPSTTRGEAFGMVLIEAMACGIPVVASNLPGVRSVVEDGVNGRLVPPGDATALVEALRALLADSEMRQRMGRDGRMKTERIYDWRLIGLQLERLYLQALGISGESPVALERRAG
jgi:glycosyltransferase involved in cell wall biosynthesis